MLPPPPLWVRMPRAPKGLTAFGLSLIMRDASVLDNRLGYEIVQFYFQQALQEPMEQQTEGVKVEFFWVSGGRDMPKELRCRLKANQQSHGAWRRR